LLIKTAKICPCHALADRKRAAKGVALLSELISSKKSPPAAVQTMAAVGAEKQSASKYVAHQYKEVLHELRGTGDTLNHPSNHRAIKRRSSLWRGGISLRPQQQRNET
jgi:hypothetical protein